MDKIEENWNKIVAPEDWVLVCGDLSWATYLDEAVADFDYLHLLPGRKILCKGNHDYWWTTLSKMYKFLDEKGFDSIFFLHNNSFVCQSVGICGTRGWLSPDSPGFTQHDEKIFNRELGRLELSLKDLKGKAYDEVVVMLHYPPFYPGKGPGKLLDLLKEYDVGTCIYGHLHGQALEDAVEGPVEGIEFIPTSCDKLDFKPVRLY